MKTTFDSTPDHITLYYRAGNSDKVYQAAIEPAGDGLYVVNFAYGRRGATMNTGTKTQKPVGYAQARVIYDRLVGQKMAKGYTPGEDGTPYVGTDRERRDSGLHCQLLNAIDQDELDCLLCSNEFVLQEKFDGRRMIVRKLDGTVTGINRLGLEVGLPQTIADCACNIPGDVVIDGEAVGDTLHAFDLLFADGRDLREEPYRLRLAELERLLGIHPTDHIRLVRTYALPRDKWTAFEELDNRGAEGIVFKKLDAPYTADRPASGGTQLKFKFYETASCIVTGRNDRRSVALGLMLDGNLIPCGNVAIPSSQPVPSPGQIVDVRFLYAIPSSNALYQPVYLGVRDDIPDTDCSLDQLKYKAA